MNLKNEPIKDLTINETLFITRLVKSCDKIGFVKSEPLVLGSGFSSVKTIGYDKTEANFIETKFKERFNKRIKLILDKNITQTGKIIRL